MRNSRTPLILQKKKEKYNALTMRLVNLSFDNNEIM